MLGQLGAQRRLDHPARELREQSARSGDPLGLQALQRVLELRRRQQSREPFTGRFNGTLVNPGAKTITIMIDLCFVVTVAFPGPKGSVGHPDLTT
jgi:hypothetical protein